MSFFIIILRVIAVLTVLQVTEGYKIIAEAAKMKPPSLLVALDPHEDIIGKKIGEVGRLLEYAANQVYNAARNGNKMC
jgi:hypothetical protein